MTLLGAVSQIMRVNYGGLPSRKGLGSLYEISRAAGTVAAASMPRRYELDLSALAREIEYALIAYPVGIIRLRKV
jgi:hypothetical protein